MCFDAPVIRSLTRKFRLILLALLRSERFSFNDCLGGTAWVTFQTNTWKINPQNSEVHLRRPFIAAPSSRIRWILRTKSALQSGNFLIRYESGIVWTLNPNILLSGDVTRLSPVLYLIRSDTLFKKATSFPGFLKAEQEANFARFTTHVLLLSPGY